MGQSHDHDWRERLANWKAEVLMVALGRSVISSERSVGIPSSHRSFGPSGPARRGSLFKVSDVSMGATMCGKLSDEFARPNGRPELLMSNDCSCGLLTLRWARMNR